MKQKRLEVSKDKLADFCQRNHVRWLAFFGSLLREDFDPDSDIDVLVEFEPGHVPGLGLIRMQDELSVLLDSRKVDLVTLKFLHPRIRNQVLSEMEVQYAHLDTIVAPYPRNTNRSHQSSRLSVEAYCR